MQNFAINYEIIEDNGQHILRYMAPPPYKGEFQLFMRGSLVDGSFGDPQRLAEKISYLTGKYPMIAPRQVHGVTILEPSSSIYLPCRPEGDGIFIDKTNVYGSLRFADCFPIVVQGLSPKPWIAMAHSGFKGTLKNIAKALIEKVMIRSDIKDAIAWIGPGICKKCYYRMKNDPSTKSAIACFSKEYWKEEKDKVFFDMAGIIKSQLQEVGLVAQRIRIVDLCTSCDNDLLYSYRCGDMEDRNFLLGHLSL